MARPLSCVFSDNPEKFLIQQPLLNRSKQL